MPTSAEVPKAEMTPAAVPSVKAPFRAITLDVPNTVPVVAVALGAMAWKAIAVAVPTPLTLDKLGEVALV